MLLSILFMADALSAVIVEEPIGPRSEAIEPVSPRSMIRLHQLGNAEPSVKIEELAWLEGTWIGRMPNGLVEHVILGPKAGQMPSFVRALNDNDVWFYEISVFSEDAGTVVSRVKRKRCLDPTLRCRLIGSDAWSHGTRHPYERTGH